MAGARGQALATNDADLVHEFSKRVYDDLPPEIRGIVCSFIWDDELLDDDPQPGYVRLSFIDLIYRDFAIEVVQAYYESSVALPFRSPKEISQFLDRDDFGVGVTPAQCALQNIKLHIPVAYIRSIPYLAAGGVQVFYREIEPLIDAKFGQHASVKLIIRAPPSRLVAIYWLHKISICVKPVIEELSRNGVKVFVLYTTSWFEKDVVHLMGAPKPAWNNINECDDPGKMGLNSQFYYFAARYTATYEDVDLAVENSELIPMM